MSARAVVLLVLPRADHWLAYGPLIEAIDGDPEFEAVVAGAPAPPGSRETRGISVNLYLPASAGSFGWLSFIVKREIAARRLIQAVSPAVIVVPSDVSDATVSFVEAARARRIPVVYVQGAQVFPNYVAVNAATEAKASNNQPLTKRIALRQLRSLLSVIGVHAKFGSDVLGSRADAVVVAGPSQRDVLLAGGIDPRLIHVLGAPFVDRLFRLRRRRGDEVAEPMVLILTKDLVRLGLADEPGQRRMLQRILEGIERELPGWRAVLKLHPMEDAGDYGWVCERWPTARIVGEGAAEELLLESGLVISVGTSSPALAARFLGVPVVIVTAETPSMVDAHLELFDEQQVVRAADDLATKLRETIRAGATEPPHPDPLADGHASTRIVSLFHSLIRS